MVTICKLKKYLILFSLSILLCQNGFANSEVSDLINMSISAQENNQYDLALEYLKKAEELDKSNIDIYLNRGYILKELGDIDKAYEQFTLAAKLNASDPRAFNERAIIHNIKNEFNLAITECEKAILIDPAFILPYVNKGNALYQLEQPLQAIQLYSKAIVLDKNKEGFVALLMRAKVQNEMGMYDKAVEDINQLFNFKYHLSGDTKVMAYLQRGFGYLNTNRFDLSIKDYKMVILLDPKNNLAYGNLGFAYMMKNDCKQANQAFKKSCQLGLNSMCHQTCG